MSGTITEGVTDQRDFTTVVFHAVSSLPLSRVLRDKGGQHGCVSAASGLVQC